MTRRNDIEPSTVPPDYWDDDMTDDRTPSTILAEADELAWELNTAPSVLLYEGAEDVMKQLREWGMEDNPECTALQSAMDHAAEVLG